MTMTNDRPELSSEGVHVIDKTILVNVNRNKYPFVRPTWALKPGLTDRLVVGRNVTLTFESETVFSLWSVPGLYSSDVDSHDWDSSSYELVDGELLRRVQKS
jgi:hypothetical protein